jgi:hypothetical protein
MIDRIGPPAFPAPSLKPALAPRPRIRAVPSHDRPPAAPASSPPAPTRAAPLRRILVELEQQRARLDAAVRQAAAGRSFSTAELIALQARVYAYGESLEVISHLVDRAVSAVKTTLNTQV